MKIYQYLEEVINKKGAAFLVLVDPDKLKENRVKKFCEICASSGVDGFLVGGSMVMDGNLFNTVENIKENCSRPVLNFPGSAEQITPNADALLYLSLISSRNADLIIGQHVLAAPLIKKYGIEPISTGYMLIESGGTTTAGYISNSMPIPRDKPEIAASTAMAAEYMGMKCIYLEAGSGAKLPVPDDMVKMVSSFCSIPVIVGGGIRDPQTAREKVNNGAKIIVVGNFFEDENNWSKIKSFADAVHKSLPLDV